MAAERRADGAAVGVNYGVIQFSGMVVKFGEVWRAKLVFGVDVFDENHEIRFEDFQTRAQAWAFVLKVMEEKGGGK